MTIDPAFLSSLVTVWCVRAVASRALRTRLCRASFAVDAPRALVLDARCIFRLSTLPHVRRARRLRAGLSLRLVVLR